MSTHRHTPLCSRAILTCHWCRLKQLQNFRPMDYESLRQELALKAPLWRKVSSTESHQDSSTTVVYRMDSVTEWKREEQRIAPHPHLTLQCSLLYVGDYLLPVKPLLTGGLTLFFDLNSGSIALVLLPVCVCVCGNVEVCFLLCYLNDRLCDRKVSACREAVSCLGGQQRGFSTQIRMKDCGRWQKWPYKVKIKIVQCKKKKKKKSFVMDMGQNRSLSSLRYGRLYTL